MCILNMDFLVNGTVRVNGVEHIYVSDASANAPASSNPGLWMRAVGLAGARTGLSTRTTPRH